jgi:isocitrate dehydrogenase kinase/phosphatase
MDIDVTDAAAHERMGLDKREGLDVRCDGRERKITEKSKYFAAIREVAAGKLSQNERVHEYLGIFQHARELRDPFSEMVYQTEVSTRIMPVSADVAEPNAA